MVERIGQRLVHQQLFHRPFLDVRRFGPFELLDVRYGPL